MFHYLPPFIPGLSASISRVLFKSMVEKLFKILELLELIPKTGHGVITITVKKSKIVSYDSKTSYLVTEEKKN